MPVINGRAFPERGPDELTDFGCWLWWRWPRRIVRSVQRGEGFIGLKSYRGFLWCGLLTDYYHGYWLHTGITYWRRSLWLCGIKVVKWRRWNRKIMQRDLRRNILRLCVGR